MWEKGEEVLTEFLWVAPKGSQQWATLSPLFISLLQKLSDYTLSYSTPISPPFPAPLSHFPSKD